MVIKHISRKGPHLALREDLFYCCIYAVQVSVSDILKNILVS